MSGLIERLIRELRNSKRKLKRAKNTAENKYHAEQEKYIKLLEEDRSMLIENIRLKETVKLQKDEIKKLKRGEKNGNESKL